MARKQSRPKGLRRLNKPSQRDDSVWAILEDATPAERAELERIKATGECRAVVEAGIPADSLDTALRRVIRTKANVQLDRAWRDLAHVAKTLRNAAVALTPIAALPRVSAGYDQTNGRLRTFEPWTILGDPAQLRDDLNRVADGYDRMASRLRPPRRGETANYARRQFISALDVVALAWATKPLVPQLAALHNVVFSQAIDVDSYRRELAYSRKRRSSPAPRRK